MEKINFNYPLKSISKPPSKLSYLLKQIELVRYGNVHCNKIFLVK